MSPSSSTSSWKFDTPDGGKEKANQLSLKEGSPEQSSHRSEDKMSTASEWPYSPAETPSKDSGIDAQGPAFTSGVDDESGNLSDLSSDELGDDESQETQDSEYKHHPQEFERALELVYSVGYWYKRMEAKGASSVDKKQSKKQIDAIKEREKRNERQSLGGADLNKLDLEAFTATRYKDCPYAMEKKGTLFEKLDYYQIDENEDFLNVICDYKRVIEYFLCNNRLASSSQEPNLDVINAFVEGELDAQIQSLSDTELQVQAYRYKCLAEYYLKLVNYKEADNTQTDYFEGQKGLDAMCIKPRIVNLGLVLKTSLNKLSASDGKHVPFNPNDYNFKNSLLSSGLYPNPIDKEMPEGTLEGRMFFYCPFPNFLTEMEYDPKKTQGHSKPRKLRARAWHMVMFYQYLKDVKRADNRNGTFTKIQPKDIEIFNKIKCKVKLLPEKEKYEKFEKNQFTLEAYNNFVSPKRLELAKKAESFEKTLEEQIRDFTSWFFLYLCPEINMNKQKLGIAIDAYHKLCEEEVREEHLDQSLIDFAKFPTRYFTSVKKVSNVQIHQMLAKESMPESTPLQRDIRCPNSRRCASDKSRQSLKRLLGGSPPRSFDDAGENESLKKKVDELTHTLETKETILKNSKENEVSLRQKLTVKQEKIQSLEEELQFTKNALKASNRFNSVIQQKIKSLSEKLESKHKELVEQEKLSLEKIKVLTENHRKAQSESKSEHELKISDLKAQCKSTEAQKKKLTEEVGALTKQLSELESHLASSNDERKAQNRHLVAPKQERSTTVKQRKKQLDQLDAQDLKALKNVLKKGEKVVAAIKSALDVSKGNLQSQKDAESSGWQYIAMCFGGAVVLATAPLWLPGLVMMLYAHVAWLSSAWFSAGLLIAAAFLTLAGWCCTQTCSHTVNSDYNNNDFETFLNDLDNIIKMHSLNEEQIILFDKIFPELKP